jgi:hypothetical protein
LMRATVPLMRLLETVYLLSPHKIYTNRVAYDPKTDGVLP